MMTIASRSPPKEKAEEEKPGEKEDSPKGGGIKRSRRRSSLRDIHYSNKGKGAAGVSSGVERTRRRGSAPGPLKVPSVEPVLPTPEQNPTADTPVDDQADQAEDDLVGEGFDADDAAGEDAGDLDGFGKCEHATGYVNCFPLFSFFTPFFFFLPENEFELRSCDSLYAA